MRSNHKESGNDLLDNVAGHIGETEVPAAVAVGKPGMIDPQLVQYCGVQIMHVHALLGGLKAEIVGGAVSNAAFETAARHQGRESGRVVIAAVANLLQRAVLNHRSASKFTADEDNRRLEKAA